jgi:purine-nucleoside phosphorylase
MIEKVNETVDYLKNNGFGKPEIGIILGTGLGKLVDEIEVEKEIEYQDIPNFPVATVEFHSGKLIYGSLHGKKIVAMKGRFHFYEGYSAKEISLPIIVMKKLGIQKLLISNAGGAMNPEYKKGELMLLDDHINLLPDNPLRGENDESLGVRFPDMSRPYSKDMNTKLVEIAQKHDIVLHQGVYVAVPGPNLETRAEYRYLRMIGGDVVGMSTVPEVIAANHMQIPCAAISVLTDECDPDHLEPVDIADIIEVAGKAEVKLIKLFNDLISQL